MKCKYCQKQYNNDFQNLSLHQRVCLKNPQREIYKTCCQFCGKEFTNQNSQSTKASIFGNLKLHQTLCQKNLNRILYHCQKCGKEFTTKSKYTAHIKKCGTFKYQLNGKEQHYTNCKFCGKQILQFGSLKAHEKQCKENPNRVIPKIGLKKFGNNKPGPKGPSWIKGLTKQTSQKVRNRAIKAGETLRKHIDQGLISIGRAKTPEKEELRKQHISEAMKLKGGCGGCRKGSGRGKHGWYKGYWCDSSWQLAFIIYNLQHNINFQRNTTGFEYQFNGELHKYFPDFILENGNYVQIKGAMTARDQIKIGSFKFPLIVIDKHSIKIYLDYAIEKYGKNFIDVYQKFTNE